MAEGRFPLLAPSLKRLAAVTIEKRFENAVVTIDARYVDLHACQLGGGPAGDVDPGDEPVAPGVEAENGIEVGNVANQQGAGQAGPIDPALLALLNQIQQAQAQEQAQAQAQAEEVAPMRAEERGPVPGEAGSLHGSASHRPPAVESNSASVVVQIGSCVNRSNSVLPSGTVVSAAVHYDTFLVDLANVPTELGADGLPIGVPQNLVVDSRGRKATAFLQLQVSNGPLSTTKLSCSMSLLG